MTIAICALPTMLLQIQCIPLLRAADYESVSHLGVKVERDVVCLFVPDQQRLLEVEVSHLLHPPRPLLKYFILITGSIHVYNHLCSLVVSNNVPYSGKLSREKTFPNFVILWLFAKVFLVKFWGVASFGTQRGKSK